MSTMTTADLRRLDHALQRMVNDRTIPLDAEGARLVRELALEPTIERWDAAYNIALNAAASLSLWQAVCSVSDFPSLVAVTSLNRRAWPPALPPPVQIIAALEFALG